MQPPFDLNLLRTAERRQPRLFPITPTADQRQEIVELGPFRFGRVLVKLRASNFVGIVRFGHGLSHLLAHPTQIGRNVDCLFRPDDPGCRSHR